MRDYYSYYGSRPAAIFKPQQQQQQKRRRPGFRQPQHQHQQQQQQQLYYEPPRLSDLRRTNRLKARKFFSKKKKMHQDRRPQGSNAPRNTSSFIMRAKDLGGIASLVSPQLATPAVLATPDMSRVPIYKEGITDEVSKEWGVNGYGSMNGFIRLRPWEAGRHDVDDDSESEVDQDGCGDQLPPRQRQRPRPRQQQLNQLNQELNHAVSVQQLETRLDQDLNRFEMVYPANAEPRDLADTRMEDQESHIAHLEEENLTLKERLYVMEQEMAELRRRLCSREEVDSMDEVEQAEVCCDSDSRPATSSQVNH